MIAAGTSRAVVLPLVEDDERALLVRLEGLLEREEQMLAIRDAAGLGAIAEEREHVTARLGVAARARRLSSTPEDDAELVTLYSRLRQRHEIRAKVVRRYEERNATAASVIAQASGQAGLYDAEGRVPMRFAAA
jgi:flagellar biosynthesis/type III secretory pathway chaperone